MNCFQLIINQQNYELLSYLNIIDANNKEHSNKIIGDENDEFNDEKLKDIPKIEIIIEEELEIKLKQVKNVFDISYMFGGNESLISVENSKWYNENIINFIAWYL